MRKILLLLAVLWFGAGVAWAQQSGKLQGRVTDASNKEEVPLANVIVKFKGTQKGGAQADLEGRYVISPLNPGSYDVEISFVGYQKKIITGVTIIGDQTRFLNVELAPESQVLEQVEVVHYVVPIIDKDNTTTGGTLTKEEIQKLPTRETTTIAQTQAGVFASDDRGSLNVKGTRDAQTQYYINGVKVIGSTAPQLPTTAIEQLTVVTGGVPAQFGDAVGGIVNITTQGPSDKFYGGIEAETSAPLDKYDNNLVAFSLSGPVWKRSASLDTLNPLNTPRTLVGFFVSGQIQNSQDASPSAADVYVLKDETRKRLQETPFYVDDRGNFERTAETLRLSDLDKVKRRKNVSENNYLFNASFDIQPTRNTTITLGGYYENRDRRRYVHQYQLFNAENNPQRINTNYNAYARFTQRFNGSEDSTGLALKNAYYQIQFDYTKQKQTDQDPQFKKDFFKYGYLGNFSYTDTAYTLVSDTISADSVLNYYITNDATLSGLQFTPGTDNPMGAQYNKSLLGLAEQQGVEVNSLNNLLQIGGLQNGFTLGSPLVHGIYRNIGGRTTSYQEINNDQYRVSALGSVQLNQHSIKLGFEFEQRIQTNYLVFPPQGLWGAVRTNANRHLTRPVSEGGDTIGHTTVDGVTYAVLDRPWEYNADQQTTFDKNLRAKLNIPINRAIDVDMLRPEDLNISMFSAQELLNQELVTYQGYTYDGKRRTKKVAFEDFFTGSDTLNRPVDAFRPIYSAGFIEDKFAIDDLILRLGVRVDRYDANQKILKDKYAMVDLETVGELKRSNKWGQFQNSGEVANVPDDYAVYIDKDPETLNGSVSGAKILGFRSGDTFYDAQGTDLGANIRQLSTNNRYYQYFERGEGTANPTYRRDRKLSLEAFKDYKPQINVMPRISFSFPISEDALFFAHYDILTQRPERNGTRADNYYYLLGNINLNTINNPSLKPQKKIDYQVGFQQRITSSSGLTISAFYSDLRDLISVRNIRGAFPQPTYVTFDNFDYGTVKGMTIEYDLRRSSNLRLGASYTLQFATGTGSDATSGLNASNFGVDFLRTPVPLDYDQRHALKLNADYRFRTGEGVIAGKPWLQNAGINFTLYAGSGTPYTRQANTFADVRDDQNNRPATEGQINGSRLPSNVRASLRVDKDFAFKLSNKEGAQPKVINVYLRVQNLFNNKNVLRVYPRTGSPTDDAYLSEAHQAIDNAAVEASFQDLYRLKLQDPQNFSLPRRAVIGLTYSF